MVCGFCKASGHTIRTCTVTGAEGVRQSNALIAERKRRLRDATEWEKYSVRAESIQLPAPDIYAGHVNILFSDDCRTVEGAVSTAMPIGFLDL